MAISGICSFSHRISPGCPLPGDLSFMTWFKNHLLLVASSISQEEMTGLIICSSSLSFKHKHLLYGELWMLPLSHSLIPLWVGNTAVLVVFVFPMAIIGFVLSWVSQGCQLKGSLNLRLNYGVCKWARMEPFCGRKEMTSFCNCSILEIEQIANQPTLYNVNLSVSITFLSTNPMHSNQLLSSVCIWPLDIYYSVSNDD